MRMILAIVVFAGMFAPLHGYTAGGTVAECFKLEFVERMEAKYGRSLRHVFNDKAGPHVVEIWRSADGGVAIFARFHDRRCVIGGGKDWQDIDSRKGNPS